MLKLIYIFLGLGLCWGLQPGLEYQYRYSGRVATGITELRHQFAAVGIQADLTLQMSEDYILGLQFSNVEVGDFHDDLSCDLRSPLPITYQELRKGTELLYKSFRIFVNNNTKEFSYLEVPHDEPSWITNIRKSVVDILPLATLWSEIGSEKTGFARPNFGKKEELMGGLCMNWYSVTIMPEDEAVQVRLQRDSSIEEDVQQAGEQLSSSYTKGRGHKGAAKGSAKGAAKGSAKGSAKGHRGRKGSKTAKQTATSHIEIPSITEDLWTVTRTVDYDKCDQLVAVKINGNKKSDQLISRYSTATYLIRGDRDGIRLESALVEGAVSVFTSSSQQDHIDTFTNQTLELRAVRLISNEITIDYEIRRIHSWHYEVDSAPGAHRNLQQTLTGDQLTEDDEGLLVGRLMRAVFSGLKKLSTSYENVVVEMDSVVEAITYLSYERIAEIYVELQRKAAQAVIDGVSEEIRLTRQDINNFKVALVVAGTDTAVNFLLDKMADEEFRLEDEIAFFFFEKIQTTIKNPALVTKILDLSMLIPWSESEEIAKTIALTAAASLAHKLCLDLERRNTYKDTTCHAESVCDTETVVRTFIPYLQEGLQDKSSPIWRRVIYLQALSNLATPLTIKLLQPIILGTDESHVGFRITAIASLSRYIMPHPESVIKTVYNLLMPIISNKGEHPEVRSMAFIVMVTWQPGLSWWKHMAISTYHEPSSQVANIISSTIRTIANSGNEMSKMVSRVAYLTKPSSPTSLSYSTSIYFREYINSKHLGRESGIIWFANTEGLIPSYVFIKFGLKRLHGFSSPSRMSLYQNNMDFFITLCKTYIDQLQGKEVDHSSEASQLVSEMTMSLLEDAGITISGFPAAAELFLKSRNKFNFVRNLDIFAEGTIFPFISDLARHFARRTWENIFYNKMIDTTIAYPTDLGLPFIVQYSAQSAAILKPNYDETPVPSDFALMGGGRFTLQASQETSIRTKILVPWLMSGIGSGISTESNINIPVAARFDLNSETKQGIFRLQLPQDKVQLMKATNVPYTVGYGGLLALQCFVANDFKQIHRYDDKPSNWRAQIAPWSGIWLESSWNGDIDYPRLSSWFRGEFNFLTPTHNSWEYYVNYDHESSDTKAITTIFSYASAVKTSLPVVIGELEIFGQESQGQADYSEYSQVLTMDYQIPSFKVDDYSQFLQSPGGGGFQEPFVQDVDHTTLRWRMSEILRHINQFQDQVQVGEVRSIGASVELEGTTNYHYEAILMRVKETTHVRSNIMFKLKLQTDVPDGVLAEPHATCFDVSFNKPNFLPLVTVEDILTRDLSTIIKSEVHNGVSCDDSPVFTLQGNVEVTEEQLNNVKVKLENGCDFNKGMPVMDIITSQLYDHAELDIKWTSNYPESWKNSVYYAYDLIRGNQYPSIAFDYTTSNPDYVIHFNASKNIKTNHWALQCTKPNENSIHQEFPVPLFVGIPVFINEAFTHHVIGGRNPSICVINDVKVHTFDGKDIPFAPNDCWKIVSLEYESAKFIFQVRFTGEWEARIMWKNRGLMFDIISSEIMVNGEPPASDDGRYEVIHLDDAILLTMDNGMAIKVSDKVEIHVAYDLRAHVRGLCGDFNGETTFEMIGPQGCVYDEPKLYVDSWEVPGDGCSAFRYRSRRRKVQSYQSNCSNKTYVPTGVSHENIHNECTSWAYQERTEGYYKCKSLVPTPVCNSGCIGTSTTAQPIAYDCLLEEGHDEENVKCYLHTYTTTFSAACREI